MTEENTNPIITSVIIIFYLQGREDRIWPCEETAPGGTRTLVSHNLSPQVKASVGGTEALKTCEFVIEKERNKGSEKSPVQRAQNVKNLLGL